MAHTVQLLGNPKPWLFWCALHLISRIPFSRSPSSCFTGAALSTLLYLCLCWARVASNTACARS